MILLHTNDIHGRITGLTRIATLIEQTRLEHPNETVLYFDTGDSEDLTERMSNLSKGASMHRLLSAMGCDAVVVGNASLQRFGPEILAEHAAAASYPMLLANVRQPHGAPFAGTQPTTLLEADGHYLGLIGITSPVDGSYESFYDLTVSPLLPTILDMSAALRQDGAEAIILLSHMGLEADRELAATLQGVVDLIIGGHSHSLLPQGEQFGSITIAQAGSFAEHLGRIDLSWRNDRLEVERVSTLQITDAIPQSATLLKRIEELEHEIEQFLDIIVGDLAEPLDFALDRECGVGNLLADTLRSYMNADVGIAAVGQAFVGPLEDGPLTRLALWKACPSIATPGVTMMTGEMLRTMVERGLDAVVGQTPSRLLRGQAPGLLHLSGASWMNGQLLVAGRPADPKRRYRVAASDWEFEAYGGYIDPEWQLQPQYVTSTILREALEEYLARHWPVRVRHGRVIS